MLQEASFDTGQVQLHYAQGPAHATPLVLLHGGSARWQTWQPILPSLLEAFHVYALDLRGHGQSSWCAPYTLQTYAADIAAFLRQRVCKPAVLYGHSLGGMIGLVVAAHTGSVVRGVIVGDAPLRAETWVQTLQATRPRLEEWYNLAASGATVPELIAKLKLSPVEVPGHNTPVAAQWVLGENSLWFEWMATNLVQVDPATLGILLEDAALAAEGYRLEQLFPHIACPVWLVQADPLEGALMMDEAVKEAQRLKSDVRHRQLSGVGHALHSTHPKLVQDVLCEAVQQIERETA